MSGQPGSCNRHLRYEIISLSHYEWYNGHFGIFKAIQRIYNNYWWPAVKEDVTNFISTYKICLSTKTPSRTCGKMWEEKMGKSTVGIDFPGFFSQFTKNNQR